MASREAEVAKNKDKKRKEREKRVAQKKLAEAARRREQAKEADASPGGVPRAKKVLTAGVQQKAQMQQGGGKPTVVHRRTGG
ncbi:MAG: hypothetical protein NXI04_22495 [Planctomycetaceae bacterium]|nr:hypothetical protein [Planctomycetaceae bacterium]